jgi:hypothetical protein
VTQEAFEHTPQTNEAWQIEEYNGITGFKTSVERPSIVPIDDPHVAADECLDLGAPVLWRRWLPPRLPVERIEVDEGSPVR